MLYRVLSKTWHDNWEIVFCAQFCFRVLRVDSFLKLRKEVLALFNCYSRVLILSANDRVLFKVK